MTNLEIGWSLPCLAMAKVSLVFLLAMSMSVTGLPLQKKGRTFSPEIGLYYQGDIMFMPGESFEVYNYRLYKQRIYILVLIHYQLIYFITFEIFRTTTQW